MSPKAVKERLKTLDELWLLSVKLANSKKVKTKKDENGSAGKLLDSDSRREQIFE